MSTHSEKFIQQRRFYMVLPVLVTPFIAMMFWALGGGSKKTVGTSTPTDGLNVTLPEAHFGKKEIWDKLSLYEMAQRDSARFDQARQNDPYFDLVTVGTQTPGDTAGDKKEDNLISAFPQKEKRVSDPNEEKVKGKLEQLYREINKPEKTNSAEEPVKTFSQPADPQFTQDVNRLEAMMEMMKEPGEPDPEMQQIEGVLEKILDIQHPERVKEKLNARDRESKANAYAVETADGQDYITLIQQDRFPTVMDTAIFRQEIFRARGGSGFFGLDDGPAAHQSEGNAIEAIIHDTQELVAGSTVRLRVLQDIRINGSLIARDAFMHGVCTINDERLHIDITSVRAGNSLLPVALSVYDLDGQEGIYVPGAITRDAAKQASDNALQSMQFMTMDPSVGAQAAVAGVEAVKGIFSKKVKLIRVTVKAGYKVFLKSENPSHQ